jgi:hypothetical protein
MTNIVDYGSGDFFFIRGANSMNKVVNIAYKALIGTNAYLKIITKNDTHLVDTYEYENEIIPIGDIYYNDNMNILLENIQKREKEVTNFLKQRRTHEALQTKKKFN